MFTSGTQSPVPSYQMNLGLHYDHLIYIVGRGPGGKVLSSSFARRQDREYFAKLGNALIGVVRVTPGGMLVVFPPTYSVMESCFGRLGWKLVQLCRLVDTDRTGSVTINHTAVNHYETAVTAS
jgi:hypothetical protein